MLSDLLADILAHLPGRVVTVDSATSARGAIAAIARRRPDLILLDLVLPDTRGLDTLERVRAEAHGVPIIVLSALDPEIERSTLQRGAFAFLQKSTVQAHELLGEVRRALDAGRSTG